jgi:hypothetical protein
MRQLPVAGLVGCKHDTTPSSLFFKSASISSIILRLWRLYLCSYLAGMAVEENNLVSEEVLEPKVN